MNYNINWILLFFIVIVSSCHKNKGGDNQPVTPNIKTFVNPVVNGSDPWVYKKDSFYYYTHTLGSRIAIWKSKNVSKIAAAPTTNVFNPGTAGPNSSNIWAPEIHFFDNSWYIYYTAGSGPDITQRTWVLENSSADPTAGTWIDKGRIYSTSADFWAIDGTVFEHDGKRFFLWSGRPDQSFQNQNIYIAIMVNPWTLEPTSTILTKPELSWELNGGPVNEAPEILKTPNGNIYLIYSASGCWTDDYTLGGLLLRPGGDPMKASDWSKIQMPFLTKKPENSAYGPGHNSFFKSADGKEDWIIYHANSNSGDGCTDKRNIRIQKFTWNADGSPQFGEPVKTGAPLKVPSGE